MPPSGFKVIWIVRRRYFHRAGPKLPVHHLIRDDWNFALHQREQHLLADQRFVPLILRMHRHRGIAEHRLWPRFPHHHPLRGDSRMVHSRQVQRVVPPHPVPACQDVNLRVVQHVADVQRPGHVRRWNDDRKHGSRSVGIRLEKRFLHPILSPARLYLLRFVRFCDLASHPVQFSSVATGLGPPVLNTFRTFRVIFDYTRRKAATSIRLSTWLSAVLPFAVRLRTDRYFVLPVVAQPTWLCFSSLLFFYVHLLRRAARSVSPNRQPSANEKSEAGSRPLSVLRNNYLNCGKSAVQGTTISSTSTLL